VLFIVSVDDFKQQIRMAIAVREITDFILEVIKKTPKPSFSDATCHCHFCGAVCDSFLRQDFLHSSRFHPVMRRSGSL